MVAHLVNLAEQAHTPYIPVYSSISVNVLGNPSESVEATPEALASRALRRSAGVPATASNLVLCPRLLQWPPWVGTNLRPRRRACLLKQLLNC